MSSRREFITLLSGAAAWPLAARAQQPERMRRIGVLMLYPENDSEGQLRATALRQGLQKLGWVTGRNVQIDFQWGFGDADWIRSAAAQLLRLAPDVILANGTPAARMMQQANRTVPVMAAPLRNSNEIEAAMAEWGRDPNFGLIVVPDPATDVPLSLMLRADEMLD